MTSGGARNRSGPPPDPASARSDRRGLALGSLPFEGYRGEVPEFPLPTMLRFRWEYEDKRRFQVFDEDATGRYRERELDVWAEAWRMPQGQAWAVQSWRWAIIAEYCRLKTVVEGEPDANASLVSQLHRYRDQIGLTPAGLKENGWSIAQDQVGAKRDEVDEAEKPRKSSRDRMRVVGGSGR